MRINFADVEVKDNSPVPNGTYLVNITKIEERTASTGNQGLNFTYEIAEGELAGRKIYDNVYLSENSLWRLKLVLAAVGGYDAEGDIDIEPDDLLGKQITVTTALEKQKEGKNAGKSYANIKRFESAGDGEGSLLP